MKQSAARFWKRVQQDTSGCWLWIGSISHNGYGQLWIARRKVMAHRHSWEWHFGPIQSGKMICHKCDVRNCVNPDHLFIGTALENNRDCLRKGRAAIGSKNGQSKLTEDKVRRIKALPPNSNLWRVAELLGVNRSTIERVLRGDTWSHVK